MPMAMERLGQFAIVFDYLPSIKDTYLHFCHSQFIFAYLCSTFTHHPTISYKEFKQMMA